MGEPLMLGALIPTVARRAARTRIVLASAAAFLIGLVALAVNEYSPDAGGSSDFAIESAWGCFLWIASTGLMLGATVLVRSKPSQSASRW